MTSKEKIMETVNKIIEAQGVSDAAIARRIGKSSQSLNKQLNGSDLKVSTLLSIIDAMHCDVNITITDRATNTTYTVPDAE